MNIPEPDDRAAFWVAAGSNRRQRAEVVTAAALLYRADLAERHIKTIDPTDISDALLRRVAILAARHIDMLGVADIDQIARILPRFHFQPFQIAVQLDILPRVSEALTEARVNSAVTWLVQNRTARRMEAA